MSKRITKKIIIIIILVLLLIILFFVHNSYRRNVKPDSITIVKKIMKNKYDKIEYKNNNYIFGYYKDNSLYKYDVYDLNGNKQYSFYREKIVNIKSVNKNYFIETSDEDYLYNDDDELMLESNLVNPINDYLIKVDNRIINYKNKELFNNVEKIDSYDNDFFFNIDDNYLIDKKGNIILTGYKVIEEIENNFIIKYFILKSDNKYYTFMPSLERIVGDSFDYYYKSNGKIFILDGDNEYRLYYTGLRKKLEVNNKKLNEYKIEKIISNKYAFVSKDKNFGMFDRDDNKFYKISDSYIDVQYLSKNHYLIKTNDLNIIYNVKEKKYEYYGKINLDKMIMYKNGYKVLYEDGVYNLYNNKNILLKKADKQIVLIDSQIKFGKILKDVYVFNNDNLIKAETFKMNSSNYALYTENSKKIIIGLDNKNKFSSNNYLNYYKNTVVYDKGKNIVFYNMNDKEKNEYELDNYEIISLPFKNIIVLKNNESLKVIDFDGKELKILKNIEIKDIIYNNNFGKIILITAEKDNNNLKESSYILK